jgi:hypothetical protein
VVGRCILPSLSGGERLPLMPAKKRKSTRSRSRSCQNGCSQCPIGRCGHPDASARPEDPPKIALTPSSLLPSDYSEHNSALFIRQHWLVHDGVSP